MFDRYVEKEMIINLLLHDDEMSARKTYKMEMREPRDVQPKHIIEDAANLGDILHELKQNVFNQRFLIVFEDVHMEKKHILEEFMQSLSCSIQGSKIVVTASKKQVATLGTVQPINLKFLPFLEYWFFFKAHAFDSIDVEENPGLVEASKSIAMKMNGSFFGAKIIGSMIRRNPNLKFWFLASQNFIGG
ncbi:putative disease resistance protein At3g14460 [Oryza brachyantha]|uniref:putative disease resistance protein At3g14460 n=1 Tax=Oryza brachyantha TaxID=4533 RepID=UPI000776656F|nr:putative disease resistance protein At3g14460 [Oryza brachyantha]XP_015698609.1 putative disease resistance protein At3g14460 [Oryza brachyantha]